MVDGGRGGTAVPVGSRVDSYLCELDADVCDAAAAEENVGLDADQLCVPPKSM